MDKPLHVQVAEVLGWKVDPNHYDGWKGEKPDALGEWYVPDFTTDWSATGPLIEEHGISLKWVVDRYGGVHWIAFKATQPEWTSSDALRPLEAVCGLILELGKAGKL